MAGLTIGDIRTALHDQLRGYLDRETNIEDAGQDKPFPRIRIVLAGSPTYTTSYGGLAVVPFRLIIEPAGVDESAVRRLDDYLSAGLGNNSSVVDALRLKGGDLAAVAQIVEIEPGDYDAETVSAELLVTVHVLKIRA
jgi:hypothetical protein